MQIGTLVKSAFLAALISTAGCMANSSEPSTTAADDFEKVATTKAALKTTSPLYQEVLVDAAGVARLDVMTCTQMHDTDSLIHPCRSVGTGVILYVLVGVYNTTGRLIDVQFIRNLNAEGPGGGCLHATIPNARPGDRIVIDGIVRTDAGRYEIRRGATEAVSI